MIISIRYNVFRLHTNAFRSSSTQTGLLFSNKEPCTEDKMTAALTLSPLDFSSESSITSANLTKILTNFKEPKAYYRQKVLEGNRELSHIYTGNLSLRSTFQKIFPELVQSRGITLLHELDRDGNLFNRWNEGKNDITVELCDDESTIQQNDNSTNTKNQQLDALFIGGPSTMTAGLLYQLRYPNHRIRHVFADRFDSNYDGSAYYYHQRDAAPVYINRVNRGPYCVYIDLYKRLIDPRKLAHQAETNRHHVKISLNWSNIKPRYVFTIFIPNVWHMVTDLWIKNKKKSKIAHVIQHACRSVPIVHAVSASTGLPVETMLIHNEKKANYVGFSGANTDPKTHFKWLNKFAHIPFQEISCEGFGSEVVQVLNFPNDGLVAPMIIETLKKQLTENSKLAEPELQTSISTGGFQLKKLFVKPISSNIRSRLRVVRIEWMNTITGSTHSMSADRLFISLGPSAQYKIVPPKITWLQHAYDVLRGSTNRSFNVTGGYVPTVSSLWRHTLNSISNTFLRGLYCCKDFFWASGSSSVLFLGVDLSEVDSTKLDVLSRFVDGVNQHWTLIGQRDVTIPLTNESNPSIKTYRFFAIQMTGGGNFPSRLIRPDYMLNLLYTTEKMYGLDVMKNAVYDIVQSRGCGRAVSAQNSIQFKSLADNTVINYALGGIGMTTMFPNGEKMFRMIEEHDSLLRKTDRQSNLPEDFLADIDYSCMTDDKQHLARSLGFDNSMSNKERKFLKGLAYILAISLGLTSWIKREKIRQITGDKISTVSKLPY